MRNTLSSLLFAAALAAVPVTAQEPSSFDKVSKQDPASETTVRGTVASMSGRTLAIETPAGNRMEFEIDAGTVLPTAVYAGSHVLVTYGPRETGINRVVRVEPAREGQGAPEGGLVGLPPHRVSSNAPAPSGAANGTATSPVDSGVAEPQVLEPAPMKRTPPRRYMAPLVSVLLAVGAVGVWTLARRRRS